MNTHNARQALCECVGQLTCTSFSFPLQQLKLNLCSTQWRPLVLAAPWGHCLRVVRDLHTMGKHLVVFGFTFTLPSRCGCWVGWALGLGMRRQFLRQVCGRFENRNFSYKFLSALSKLWMDILQYSLWVRMSGVKQGCVRFGPTKNITFGSAAAPRPCGAGCLTPPTKTKPSVRHLLHQQQK